MLSRNLADLWVMIFMVNMAVRMCLCVCVRARGVCNPCWNGHRVVKMDSKGEVTGNMHVASRKAVGGGW